MTHRRRWLTCGGRSSPPSCPLASPWRPGRRPSSSSSASPTACGAATSPRFGLLEDPVPRGALRRALRFADDHVESTGDGLVHGRPLLEVALDDVGKVESELALQAVAVCFLHDHCGVALFEVLLLLLELLGRALLDALAVEDLDEGRVAGRGKGWGVHGTWDVASA